MKFYDREGELELLRRNLEQSKQSSCFTVMVGRRLIGKTMLLLKSVAGQKYLYLFVARKSEQLLCAQFKKEHKRYLDCKYLALLLRFGIFLNS